MGEKLGIESIMFDPLVVGIQHGPYSIDPGIESSLIDKRDRLGSRVDLYANAQDEMEQLQRKKVISSLGSLVLGHFSDIRFT